MPLNGERSGGKESQEKQGRDRRGGDEGWHRERRRAATAAAQDGLNVMSFVTTHPSSGECYHPEGGGTTTRVIV